MKVLCWL